MYNTDEDRKRPGHIAFSVISLSTLGVYGAEGYRWAKQTYFPRGVLKYLEENPLPWANRIVKRNVTQTIVDKANDTEEKFTKTFDEKHEHRAVGSRKVYERQKKQIAISNAMVNAGTTKEIAEMEQFLIEQGKTDPTARLALRLARSRAEDAYRRSTQGRVSPLPTSELALVDPHLLRAYAKQLRSAHGMYAEAKQAVGPLIFEGDTTADPTITRARLRNFSARWRKLHPKFMPVDLSNTPMAVGKPLWSSSTGTALDVFLDSQVIRKVDTPNKIFDLPSPKLRTSLKSLLESLKDAGKGEIKDIQLTLHPYGGGFEGIHIKVIHTNNNSVVIPVPLQRDYYIKPAPGAAVRISQYLHKETTRIDWKTGKWSTVMEEELRSPTEVFVKGHERNTKEIIRALREGNAGRARRLVNQASEYSDDYSIKTFPLKETGAPGEYLRAGIVNERIKRRIREKGYMSSREWNHFMSTEVIGTTYYKANDIIPTEYNILPESAGQMMRGKATIGNLGIIPVGHAGSLERSSHQRLMGYELSRYTLKKYQYSRVPVTTEFMEKFKKFHIPVRLALIHTPMTQESSMVASREFAANISALGRPHSIDIPVRLVKDPITKELIVDGESLRLPPHLHGIYKARIKNPNAVLKSIEKAPTYINPGELVGMGLGPDFKRVEKLWPHGKVRGRVIDIENVRNAHGELQPFVRVVVQEEIKLQAGQKAFVPIKGVFSAIIPEKLMPSYNRYWTSMPRIKKWIANVAAYGQVFKHQNVGVFAELQLSRLVTFLKDKVQRGPSAGGMSEKAAQGFINRFEQIIGVLGRWDPKGQYILSAPSQAEALETFNRFVMPRMEQVMKEVGFPTYTARHMEMLKINPADEVQIARRTIMASKSSFEALESFVPGITRQPKDAIENVRRLMPGLGKVMWFDVNTTGVGAGAGRLMLTGEVPFGFAAEHPEEHFRVFPHGRMPMNFKGNIVGGVKLTLRNIDTLERSFMKHSGKSTTAIGDWIYASMGGRQAVIRNYKTVLGSIRNAETIMKAGMDKGIASYFGTEAIDIEDVWDAATQKKLIGKPLTTPWLKENQLPEVFELGGQYTTDEEMVIQMAKRRGLDKPKLVRQLSGRTYLQKELLGTFLDPQAQGGRFAKPWALKLPGSIKLTTGATIGFVPMMPAEALWGPETAAPAGGIRFLNEIALAQRNVSEKISAWATDPKNINLKRQAREEINQYLNTLSGEMSKWGELGKSNTEFLAGWQGKAVLGQPALPQSELLTGLEPLITPSRGLMIAYTRAEAANLKTMLPTILRAEGVTEEQIAVEIGKVMKGERLVPVMAARAPEEGFPAAIFPARARISKVSQIGANDAVIYTGTTMGRAMNLDYDGDTLRVAIPDTQELTLEINQAVKKTWAPGGWAAEMTASYRTPGRRGREGGRPWAYKINYDVAVDQYKEEFIVDKDLTGKPVAMAMKDSTDFAPVMMELETLANKKVYKRRVNKAILGNVFIKSFTPEAATLSRRIRDAAETFFGYSAPQTYKLERWMADLSQFAGFAAKHRLGTTGPSMSDLSALPKMIVNLHQPVNLEKAVDIWSAVIAGGRNITSAEARHSLATDMRTTLEALAKKTKGPLPPSVQERLLFSRRDRPNLSQVIEAMSAKETTTRVGQIARESITNNSFVTSEAVAKSTGRRVGSRDLRRLYTLGERAGQVTAQEGAKLVEMGAKTLGIGALIYLGINFFRPNQVPGLGGMPGRGGEYYDRTRDAQMGLPYTVPINVPEYTWNERRARITPWNPVFTDRRRASAKDKEYMIPILNNIYDVNIPRIDVTHIDRRYRQSDMYAQRMKLSGGY